MKTMMVIAGCIIVLLTLSHTKVGADMPKQKNNTAFGVDTASFKTGVQPLLQKNCSPCHFPGGKMYSKMPFDKGETILDHEDGILKRFKDKKEENVLIKQFIKQSRLQGN